MEKKEGAEWVRKEAPAISTSSPPAAREKGGKKKRRKIESVRGRGEKKNHAMGLFFLNSSSLTKKKGRGKGNSEDCREREKEKGGEKVLFRFVDIVCGPEGKKGRKETLRRLQEGEGKKKGQFGVTSSLKIRRSRKG